MLPEFEVLRTCLCPTQAEWRRFETLIRSIVLATDIMDKDLKADRNARWDKVFGKPAAGSTKEETDRLKATIVLEHLIQASDIAHTMQHWHIYVKWNERLFEEMYKAYTEGRADKDPSENWYQGEIGFFDFYIIPLAKKLHECGVFGVSSDEFLSYAMNNRSEWEMKGREVVAGYVEKYCTKKRAIGAAPLGEEAVATERMFI
jgi:3'5'-cyclic nucleotide phosphodiesterase